MNALPKVVCCQPRLLLSALTSLRAPLATQTFPRTKHSTSPSRKYEKSAELAEHAERMTPAEEFEFYSRPDNVRPQGPGQRRKGAKAVLPSRRISDQNPNAALIRCSVKDCGNGS